jgi:hypothetical protein
MNRFARNICSRVVFAFPAPGFSGFGGKRQDGFSNFGREAFFFRRKPARAKKTPAC